VISGHRRKRHKDESTGSQKYPGENRDKQGLNRGKQNHEKACSNEGFQYLFFNLAPSLVGFYSKFMAVASLLFDKTAK
jgi:hypothetical protein